MWTATKLKFDNDKRGKNFESHGKQHGGRKCNRLNPLTAQRNA